MIRPPRVAKTNRRGQPRAGTIEDIKRDPRIGLSFVGGGGWVGSRVFVAIEPSAE